MTDGDQQPAGAASSGDEPPATAPRDGDGPPGHPAPAVDNVPAGTAAPNGTRPADGDDRTGGTQRAEGPQLPATRRRWRLWAAVGLVLVLLACGVPGVLLLGLVPGAAGRPAAERDDRGTPAERRLRERMAAQLDRQAAALLDGDRAGFLAVAEPAARPALIRRYTALRALRVTAWRPAADGVPAAVERQPGEWRLAVTVGYCFVVPGCTPSSVELGTRWRVTGDGEPRLTAVEESRAAPAGARPWEVSDLAVAVGKRAVVATTPALRAKLPGLLAQAEAAAKVADLYAVAGAPPDRYLVYYAGRAEWQRWYGGGRPKWTAGYAVGVGGGHHDVVLNAQSLTPTGVDDLLRHELTHAASLPDRGYADRSSWWLVEGLAEYAGADGQPVDRYEGLAEVRKLVRGGWNGRLDALAPADNAADDRVGGAYGTGYLAVRHLVDRYGEQRVLAFFRAVVHDQRSVAEAADEVFGDPWPGLHDDCVAYVRAAVG
ncbi:hypothetical protein [Micromonospora sp. AMSO31t]|uniref:hypothetical protein n=1 Tax=Micromonospora sp. AMSO31t TaxID=2650566 RepID=UPI00124B2795|nr:hypothetical protein [Micromonospora sp. AMSO31t]KAB1915370.1 hypothetical protein F8274_03810 [Micromonospora sp. AMSO31t]